LKLILKIPTNKSPGPDDATGEIYQIFRKELTPTFLKLFQKLTEEGNFQTHSMSLTKVLSILFIFSDNQILFSLTL